jgi:PadR family transcriptional regulator
MRRKAGTLVPLEIAICRAAVTLRRGGNAEFHGYQIARFLGAGADTRLLTAYGTLYRALDRLEKMGLLKSHWEDPRIPARENRPGRRLYTLTALGEEAIVIAPAQAAASRRKRLRRGLVPA